MSLFVRRKTHASYLAPTYLSLGILNVGGVRQGEIPATKEWLSVLRTLPGDAQEYLAWIDPHTIHPENIRKTESGYLWIDYGCTGDPEAGSITHFLITWQSALEEKLQLTDINNTS